MSKIPLFITNKMKQELSEMGFDKNIISTMKPEEAWSVLEGKVSKSDYVLNKCYKLLGKKRPTQEEVDNMDLPSIDELERFFNIPNSNISDESFNEIKDLGLSKGLNLN